MLAWRKLGRVVDGKFVPAPQRVERVWAWLMARRAPTQPPRRITVAAFWVVTGSLLACDWIAPWFMAAVLRWLWLAWTVAAVVLGLAVAGFGISGCWRVRKSR